VHFAAQAIAAGDMRYAIGAGVESMSRTPMFLDITLGGEFRGFESLNPQLLEHHDLIHQGESAERVADRWHLTRHEVDDYARDSHAKAHAARDAGLCREVVPTPAAAG
jgi:acetyl-CoA C-acetyltransferase/acetyl-CoA acyltransferase